MKVSELIEMLKDFDPELEVTVYDYEHGQTDWINRFEVENDELVIYA